MYISNYEKNFTCTNFTLAKFQICRGKFLMYFLICKIFVQIIGKLVQIKFNKCK